MNGWKIPLVAVAAFTVLSACRSRGGPPEGGGTELPAAAAATDDVPGPSAAAAGEPEPPTAESDAAGSAAEPLARTTCRAEGEAAELPLYDALPIGDTDGTTWLRAFRFRPPEEPEPVLVSLDVEGAAAFHPLPSDAMWGCAEPGRLHLLRIAAEGGRLLHRTVDVSDPDAPVAGPERTLPDLFTNGWVQGFACGGGLLAVSVRLSGPGTGNERWRAAVIDAADHGLVADLDLFSGWDPWCVASACFFVGVTGIEGPASVTRVARDGTKTSLPVSQRPGCTAMRVAGARAVVVAGTDPDGWMGVRVEPDGTMKPLPITPDTPVPEQCILEVWPDADRPGLVEDRAGRSVLYRWDPATGAFGATDTLPPSARFHRTRVAFDGAVVEVAWDNTSGMTHSPTDEQGRRRYYQRWNFTGGEIGDYRWEDDAWVAGMPVPLAAEPAEGTVHHGYVAHFLRRADRLSVLLVPGGPSDPAVLQPYVGPCPGS